MAYSFSQLQDIKNRYVRDLADKQAKLAERKASFAALELEIAALQSGYTQWASDVDAYLQSHAANEAAKVLHAEKESLVAEGVAAKGTAIELKDAVEGKR